MRHATLTALLLATLSLGNPLAARAGTAPSPATKNAVTPPVVPRTPFDINSATPQALARLPGGSEAEAARIVAGRPYGSKGQLVSRHAMDATRYEQIRHVIVARQPYKDAARNAALQNQRR